jgi:uracil-DNA glycosylase family 4
VTLEELRLQATKCPKCPALHDPYSRLVFGEGSATAKLMIIGEAPGKYEAEAGIPFVGAAGKLLDKMLNNIGMSRSDIFICNTIQCRPSDENGKNREPSIAEVQSCVGSLYRKISIIRPSLIACLGRFATLALLNTNHPLKNLRGKLYAYQGIRVMVTYHPASLIYHPTNKQASYEDFEWIKKILTE